MISETHNNFPLLQTYKEKSGCRIFIEDFLSIAIPFTVVIGGILLIALLL